ncbi:MAG: helix-turn-helix transcriptional regulator [Oscillospiraceae bacterium]|nr:helix-turn-helix transcriptional regulator [Oscillospiraceae bacterium]
MVLHTNEAVRYAPLYIHSFQLVQPHTLVEAEKFNIHYSDPSQIHNTPDKLRWYRYKHGLRQRDVAEYAGIERSTYSSYEENGRDHYPIGTMRKIAELFSIPVTELLDEFNLFLYHGQGQRIK